MRDQLLLAETVELWLLDELDVSELERVSVGDTEDVDDGVHVRVQVSS